MVASHMYPSNFYWGLMKIEILLDENSEIHQVVVENFGEVVLQKIIDLIKMKEDIKGNNYDSNDNNLSMILAKLLSGGIDIDRIDYIFRDSFYVTGERNDFSAILDNIDLEYIDDSLEIVYDAKAEYLIANFFNKRFELYDTIYFGKPTRVLEAIFGNFIKELGFQFTWNTTEVEIQNLFRENLNNPDPIISRYAKLLYNRQIDEHFIIVEINNQEKYEYYQVELFSKVPILANYPECFLESNCKSSIYSGNKIFIRKDGLIKDISECSKILNSELKKEKYILGIDLDLLKTLLKKDGRSPEEIKDIIKETLKATANEIEQEKKYVFTDEANINPIKGFKIVRDELGLGEAQYIENVDTYYDCESILEKYRINVRRRVSNGDEEWTVKRPLNDKTSISKRIEKNFKSLEDVLAFLQKEWNIPINHLEETLTLKTLRAKYNLDYNNGLFEIVFDKTTPFVNGEVLKPNYMIECELKKGNSSGLFLINRVISKLDFIKECKFSKKEIAMMQSKH